MKQIKDSKKEQLVEGKIPSRQSVKKINKTVRLPLLEAEMNVHILTVFSAIGLGVLVFLAHKLSRAAAYKPIFIEQRRIDYKRRYL
jgi:hypothetical protein